MPFQDCPLKEGEVAWVYCNSTVVIGPALLNQLPLLLLLQHAQSCAFQQLGDSQLATAEQYPPCRTMLARTFILERFQEVPDRAG